MIGWDCRLSTLCHRSGFVCQEWVLETFPGAGYVWSEDGVIWLWHPLVNLYIWLTISSCYGSIPLALGLIGRDGGFRSLCYGWRFGSQQRVQKLFPGPGYLWSEVWEVWLWYPLVNFYIWYSISSCHSSIPLVLGLRGRDGGLSTLCHSWGFACHQRVLKTFSGPGYLFSEEGVVWLWHPLVNFGCYSCLSSELQSCNGMDNCMLLVKCTTRKCKILHLIFHIFSDNQWQKLWVKLLFQLFFDWEL